MNKDEKQIIYEIYRACRLCGAGAGYKMPIIQSVIDLDGEDIELSQKIKDCLQIEVTHNDRMPPLICELCVDKINDFHEFRAMCHETNKKTRLRLGLPLEKVTREVPEAEDCILGVTEPVYIDSDSDGDTKQPLQQIIAKTKPRPKSKVKKDTDVKAKIENQTPVNQSQPPKEKIRSPSPEVVERRETRRKRPPSPKRSTRHNRPDDLPLSTLQGLQISRNSPPKPGPKSLRRDTERQKEREKEKNDESLAALRSKRAREKEVLVDTPIPAKKAKLPEPPKPERTSRPGPKSSKVAPPPPPPKPPTNPPPKAGPKSKKQDSTPPAGPKSRKQETPPVFGPKSKKQESPPVVVPKSRKQEVPPVSTLRSKKRDPTPPPPSKAKRREPSPPKAVRASPQPQKSYDCRICRTRNKTAQGLSSHLKVHIPVFTSPKLACNACELWFCSSEEATWHHRRHTNRDLPYTCTKCYDDFRTVQDYELHFSRDQCLPTYEVPDVKCDECWRLFPTYKLLEDHKCLGEAGRPGGKCSKCSRTYSLLKHLISHEIRCNVKKKGETIVDPEVSRKLLPMIVRISKCDNLLKKPTDGRYDVSGVSHRFGLDGSCAYPYLYSMGDVCVKSEPVANEFDHMVSIDDDIKEEYLKSDDEYVNWDSDGSENSDSEVPKQLNLCTKRKTIDTLFKLSIKTIFSPKCLGKVPRRRRKIKSEKGFDSILSIGFPGGFRKNIDHIIDSLGKESMNSDYDSDSILDNGNEQSNCSGVSHDVLDNTRTNIDELDTSKPTNKESDSASNRISEKNEKNEENLCNTDRNITTDDQSIERSKNPSLEETQNVGIDHCASEEMTNISNPNTNEDAKLSLDSPQKHTEAMAKIKDLDNKLTKDPKNGHVVNDTLIVKVAETLSNSDSDVSCMKASIRSGKINVDQHNDEIKSNNGIINSTDVNIALTDDSNVEMSDQNEKLIHDKNDNESVKDDSQPPDEINVEKDNLNETDDSKSDVINNKNNGSDEKFDQNEKISHDKNDNDSVKSDYQSPDVINDVKDNVNEADDSPSDEINYKNYGSDEKETPNNTDNDSQSSEVIAIKNDYSNEADKDDSQSYVTNDMTNHSDNTNTENNMAETNDKAFDFVNNDCVDKIDSNNSDTIKIDSEMDTVESTLLDSPMPDTIDKVNDKNDDNASGSIDSREHVGDMSEISLQSSDRFNINDLNDDDKQLMAELDAQIGDNEPKSSLIGGKENRSAVIGSSERNSDVIGENDSSVVSSDVKRKKDDYLNELIEKRDSDLKSLDLDSISDEEFNFDI